MFWICICKCTGDCFSLHICKIWCSPLGERNLLFPHRRSHSMVSSLLYIWPSDHWDTVLFLQMETKLCGSDCVNICDIHTLKQNQCVVEKREAFPFLHFKHLSARESNFVFLCWRQVLNLEWKMRNVFRTSFQTILLLMAAVLQNMTPSPGDVTSFRCQLVCCVFSTESERCFLWPSAAMGFENSRL